MSEGIRIRPRSELQWHGGAMVVVTDHARPFPPPLDGTPMVVAQPMCSICAVQHFAKTYHIQLRAGSAIVSSEVWAQLQRIVDNPFEMVNTVADPPAQGISPGTNRPIELIEKFVMPLSSPN